MGDLIAKLEKYRTQNGMDQVDMAKALGVSVRTYGEIERKGVVKKAKDADAIRQLIGEFQQNSADPIDIIADLTSSVRSLAESNKILARNNEILVLQINSPKGEKASGRVPPEGTGSSTPYKVRLLSGRKKQTDTDQE